MINKKNTNSLLWKYASLATQLIVALGLAVFVGIKVDENIKKDFVLCAWLFPLLVIAALMYKVIKDTAPKK
jgi:hypothetical protein